jgi:hypothetical protein
LRWFISAPASADLRPLLEGLDRRGAEAYVLSDVAQLGASSLQSVQEAIGSADMVLVVVGDDPTSANSFFEAGLAMGLGKPVLIVADPNVQLPADMAGILVIRAHPNEWNAIDFALNQAEGRSSSRPHTFPEATGRPLGALSDRLIARISQLPAQQAGRTAVDVLVEAIEASGAVAARSPTPDHGFDLGVWSDDLDAIAANPLLIEVKRSAIAGSFEQVLRALRRNTSARAALIVYINESVDYPPHVYFPVLAISLKDLLTRMRTASFAEVIRDLRNRSIHGLPKK